MFGHVSRILDGTCKLVNQEDGHGRPVAAAAITVCDADAPCLPSGSYELRRDCSLLLGSSAASVAAMPSARPCEAAQPK